MKTVKGNILYSTPISIFKAASILSNFVSAENGASQAVSAYLRRALDAFNQHKNKGREEGDSVVTESGRNKLKKKKRKDGSVVNPNNNGEVKNGGKFGIKEVEEKLSKKRKSVEIEEGGEGEVGSEEPTSKKKKKRRRRKTGDGDS